MDGVHLSRRVEWRWCALLLSARCSGVTRALLIPLRAGEYCCHVVHCFLLGVWCVWVSVCLWCSCGGVSSVRSPLTVVDGGVPLWWWGAVVVVGGIVKEGRLLLH